MGKIEVFQEHDISRYKSDLDARINARTKLRQASGPINPEGLSRRDFLGTGATILLGVAACKTPTFPDGGGGGGGGGSTNVTITSKYIGLLTDSLGGGDAVLSNGLRGSVSNGSFSIANVPPGTYILRFTGDAAGNPSPFFDRIVQIQVVSGGTNTYGPIRGIERIVDGMDFDMTGFDAMCRNNVGIFPDRSLPYPDGIVKWTSVPTYHIDKESIKAVFPDPTTYNFILNRIRNAISTYPAQVSHNFFANPPIIEHDKSSEVQNLIGTDNVVVVDGFPTGTASGRQYWIGNNFIIFSGRISFARNADESVINKEISDIVGYAVDLPGGGTDSIHYTRFKATTPQQKDKVWGDVLYSPDLPPGTRKPYDTSGLVTLTPSNVLPNQQAGLIRGLSRRDLGKMVRAYLTNRA